MNEPVPRSDGPMATTGIESRNAMTQAPRWRRIIARTIDLTIVAIVFALFLTPIVAVYGGAGSPSSLLKASAWVYVGVFLILAVSLIFGKRHRHSYTTAGMSVMQVRTVRVDGATRMVRSEHLPAEEGEKRGLSAALVVFPLIVLGIAFVLFELVSYL